MQWICKLLSIFLFLNLFVIPISYSRGEHFVFGTKTEFPMSNKKTVMKDFYVNIGHAQGVKIGTKLDAYRTITTADEVNNKNSSNITFIVATLKVIHAEENISVARLESVNSLDNTPIGVFLSVMVGDMVAVSSK